MKSQLWFWEIQNLGASILGIVFMPLGDSKCRAFCIGNRKYVFGDTEIPGS